MFSAPACCPRGELEKWRDKHGKVWTVLQGEPEICYGKIKVSEPSEVIILGDGLSPEEFERQEKERKRKEKEDKYLAGTGCVDFGTARSGVRNNFLPGGAAHVVNSRKSELTAHWIDNWGNYDVANPVLRIRPGQTGKIVDFKNARYQILDSEKKCAGIISPVGSLDGEIQRVFTYGDKAAADKAAAATSNRTTAVYGDKSVVLTYGDYPAAVTEDVINPHLVAGLMPPAQPTKHQLANGCSLYGTIASKPETARLYKDKTIFNAGSTPLTVHWLSYYGQLQDREDRRTSKPTTTLEPGEAATLDSELMGIDDAFAVLEEDGQCVAVIQNDDLYVEDTEVRSRVPRKFTDGRLKNYYVLRDRKSAAEFDIRVAQWNLDKKSHKEKLAELEALWASSDCGVGGSGTDQWGRDYTDNDFGELEGRWEVGSYDRGARQQLFTDEPGFWTFTEPFQLTRQRP